METAAVSEPPSVVVEVNIWMHISKSYVVRMMSSAIHLARGALLCREFRALCAQEAERRTQCRVRWAWNAAWADGELAEGLSVSEANELLTSIPPETKPRPWPYGPDSDVSAMVAGYAGGWIALLAGREGLLDTAPHSTRQPTRQPSMNDVLGVVLIWDILRDGVVVWSGLIPLCGELGTVVSMFPSFEGTDDLSGCDIAPASHQLPGKPRDSLLQLPTSETQSVPTTCNNNDIVYDVFRPQQPNSWNHEFQISGHMECGWGHRVSLVSPLCAETMILELNLNQVPASIHPEQPPFEGASWQECQRGADRGLSFDRWDYSFDSHILQSLVSQSSLEQQLNEAVQAKDYAAVQSIAAELQKAVTQPSPYPNPD